MLSKAYFFLRKVFRRIEFKSAVKVALAATISLYVDLQYSKWIHKPDPLVSGLWSVVTSIVIIEANLGGTYKAVWNRFLGVIVGSISGAFFASLLGIYHFSLTFAMFTTMVICSLLQLSESYRIACLSAASVMIPWGFHATNNPWLVALFRFLDTCIGLSVGVAVAYSVWPSQAIIQMRLNTVKILSLLGRLFRYAYSPSYHSDRREREEANLKNQVTELFAQSREMLDQSKLELFGKTSDLSVWTELINNLRSLYRAIRNLENVSSMQLHPIFGEELKQQAQELTRKADIAFQELALKLETQHTTSVIEDLLVVEDKFDSYLKYLQDKDIQQIFHFEDIEKSFVFIYELKSIMNDLIHLNYLIDILQ